MKTRTRKPVKVRPKGPTALSSDPTRTGFLRRAFGVRVKVGWDALRRDVYTLVVRDDAFGLGKNGVGAEVSSLSLNAGEWKYRTSPQKLEEFKKWLRERIKSTVRKPTDDQLWEEYIKDGWKKGAGRSFDETDTVDPTSPPGSKAERRKQFLASSFNSPVNADRVKVLVSRTLDDFDGVTTDTATRMTRVLADGLVQGQSPREIAAALSEETELGKMRSLRVARTEIVRAHSEGQLDGLEAMKVSDVGVDVEWQTTTGKGVKTAGPCPKCQRMSGRILSIQDARGKLPLHPNCKCAWKPSLPRL